MSNFEAREGQWYAHRGSYETFCVIAVDEVHGVIDIRDGYGDVDEVAFDEWATMDLELCAAPNGWNGVFDGPEEGEFERDVTDDLSRSGAPRHY